MKTYEVAIIGGGPGGYVTAIRLSQYKINTVVVEKERLGGVCLNKGCIPTKSLVKIADLYAEILKSDEYGINVQNPTFDYEKIHQRKSEVVEKLVSGVEFIFKKRKIPVINEKAISIEKKSEGYVITTENEEFAAEYIIIATGSKPKELPFIKFDHKFILSSDDALNLTELPQDLVIIGGGVIGCEFASIFNQLGSQVQIVEFFPNLIFNEDKEISKRIAMVMKKAGIKLHLKTSVEGYEIRDDKVVLKLSNGKELETEKVLMSVGREPVFDINLKNFELKTERNFIIVDENMMTSEENIFAIGDVTGKMMLAHTASKQGLTVADILDYKIHNIPKKITNINYKNIPRCTFTNPEIASVGLTEIEAKEEYGKILTGKFPFSANGKALGMGETFGFVKTIADANTKRLLGVHIIGPNATELIAEAAILIDTKFDIERINKMIFAHPTLSESIMEAVEDLEALAIHKL